MSQGDESGTSIQSSTFALELPKYYPLHSSLGRELGSLSLKTSSKQFKELELDLQKTYEKYIDINLELNDGDLNKCKAKLVNSEQDKNLDQILQTIHKSKLNTASMTSLITKTKLEISHRYRNEEELSIDTLKQYQDIADPPLEVYDLLLSLNNSDDVSQSTVSQSSANVKRIKDQISVYIDPFTVIKDVGEGGDELEISGGKVELKCPLSQAIMVDPVITQCGHTFDKTSLQQYKRETRSNDCPVCGRTMGTVNKDEMMLVRLKAYARDVRLK